MKESVKISSLQGLRCLFAMGIVLVHFGTLESIPYFRYGGYLGVAFFFILSGYLSTFSNTSDIFLYYRKKFLRIYPIAWCALLLGLIVYIPYRSCWNSDTWWIALLDIGLLQCYYPNAYVNYSFGVSWFLCSISLFYILLPFLQRLRVRSRMSFYVLTVLMWGCHILANVWFNDIDWAISEWATYCFPLICLPQCLLGMCLYDIRPQQIKHGTIVEVLTVILLILTISTAQFCPKLCIKLYWWVPALMLLILVFANSNGLLCKLLSSRVLMGGGKVSMEIYLFHWIGIRSLPSIEYFTIDFPMWMDFSIIIMITMILVYVWHYLIEPIVMHKITQMVR